MSALTYDQPNMFPVPAQEAEYDLEKNKDVISGSASAEGSAEVESADAPVARDNVKRTGKLWEFTEKLSKFGVEGRGIERIFPHERTQKSAMGCFWMWLAANCTVSTFSLGTLGTSIWYMGFRDSVLTIVFFNLLSTIPVAYFSTWGPATGMRQLALSRYGFGYWTVMIPVVLNCIACLGWSTINTIVGGQALRAVSIESNLSAIPMAAAIVVIAMCTLVVSFTGYKVVHLYEKYSWIPVAIIFVIYAGTIGKFVVVGDWGGSGNLEAANVLSFGASIVGFGVGWSSLAADYSCNLPEDTSKVKVFFLTYFGLNLPMILIETLGAAAMATFSNKSTWEGHYDMEGIGGLLAGPLVGTMHGFGRFLMVILALSIVANNIPNMYSFALTFQVLGPWAQAIPRPLLVVVGTGIYIALAIAGADHFESALDTLLIMLAYWLAIYCTIMIEEHLIFRKGSFKNWNFQDLATPKKLPMGLAALVALILGWVGAILGMASVWYVGVLGKMIGDPKFGGDIGFELAATFAAISYPPLRYLEKRYWKY